jgi:hypothetical protein
MDCSLSHWVDHIHPPPMNELFRLATAQAELVWKVIDFFEGALTTGTARSWGGCS